MDKKELTVAILSVLSTLAETNGGPESSLYLALGADMEKWTTIKHIMVGSDLIEESHNRVTLTTKGKELAAKVDAAFASAKA